MKIDLNCDLGETYDGKLDEQIMPFITSCNVACGGHFGDEDTIKKAIFLAKKYNVSIGAHPSFPDKENFGRKIVSIAWNDLKAELEKQLVNFLGICVRSGVKCHHVKPHGALYNLAAKNATYARLIIDMVQSINSELKLFGLANSAMEEEAKSTEIVFIPEAFADRRYMDDLTLKPRDKQGAVLDQQEALSQAIGIAKHQQIIINNQALAIQAKTICLHSDTQGAVNLAKTIHQSLAQEGIQISSI